MSIIISPSEGTDAKKPEQPLLDPVAHLQTTFLPQNT
jgi:hypothetical protein